MVEHQPALPQGCIAFKQISPNVLQECAVMDDVLKPDEDGMCTGGEFSEKGITSLLRQSADLLMESNMYESVDKVCSFSLFPAHLFLCQFSSLLFIELES